MAVSYTEARSIITSIGHHKAQEFAQDEESLSLEQAVGRVCKYALRSPIATPTFDTASMDGYAVISHQTNHATPTNPLQLRVMGLMNAGDAPMEVDDRIFSDLVPCVEVRVGAPFPTARSTKLRFDACIPLQHTQILREGGEGKIVQVSNQPLTSWHKRIAGSDFRENGLILERGNIVAPKHVMALASVGVREVAVMRNVRVGVVSIGSELTSSLLPPSQQPPPPHKIPDANGLYLAAAVREMGLDGNYLGAVPSDSHTLTNFLRQHITKDNFDIIIATEGVMSGRMDQMRKSVATLKGYLHFDQVMMNPGSSAMFATLPGCDQLQTNHGGFYGFNNGQADNGYNRTVPTPPKTPAQPQQRRTEPVFFGLPGAPIASAACFRFLVTPYIKHLSGMAEESAILAKVAITPETAYARQNAGQSIGEDMVVEGSAQIDIFRHGVLRSYESGVTVEISRDRSIAKTSPFASSNCWVHVPCGHVGMGEGDRATIYPFCSPRS